MAWPHSNLGNYIHPAKNAPKEGADMAMKPRMMGAKNPIPKPPGTPKRPPVMTSPPNVGPMSMSQALGGALPPKLPMPAAPGAGAMPPGSSSPPKRMMRGRRV